MKSRAAVAFGPNEPLKIVEIDVEEPKENEVLVNYAKKGIVADKEIYERDTRIENLRNTLNRWIEKYDGLVEKTKDYFHAIKLAPQRVADFFKSLFDKENDERVFN